MINTLLEQISETSSRKQKELILNQNQDNKLFKEVVRLALDPFVQFYQRKIPEYTPATAAGMTLREAIDSLEKLSTRQVTGNAAIEHLRLTLSSVNASDAKVIEKIIQKDLRCGVAEASANKTWTNLVLEYPCMLASAFDQKLIDKMPLPAFVQLKLDGMRFNAVVKNGVVEFRSRSGKEIQINDPVFNRPFLKMAEAMKLSEVVFDGELLVVDSAGKPLDRKTGNGILNKAVKGTQSAPEGAAVRAVLWDYIPLADFQKEVYAVPYKARLHELYKAIIAVKDIGSICHLIDIVETTEANSIDEVRRSFEKYLEAGQEGIILKSKDMIWENKRSKSQVKFKGEEECDLMCVGWEKGTGKNANRLGALVLESADGQIRTNVGTGFSDAQRDEITAEIAIGKIVAVKYNAKIKDRNSDTWALFLPVFVELREDKLVADSFKDVK